MKRFHKIWLIALAVKTVLAVWLPLSNDEAYYWVWGHHPQWSYFDHPPAVGWLMWLGTWIESIGNATRLPGVFLGHFTLLIWYRILSPYIDEKRLVLWLLFMLTSPFFGLGSLVITPDVPLVFFWSLSLLLFLRLLEKPTAKIYILFGVSLGLGFCSKYMIVLFVPTALLWIGYSKQWKKIKWNYLPLTVLTGLLFCFPVLFWNYKNDWASFRFQLEHGLGDKSWEPLFPAEYLAGQLLILFPPIAWLATRRSESPQARFLHFFGWVPLAFFFYTSFKAHVEANWPIMGHPALLALAFLNGPDSKAIRYTMITWVVALLIVLSEVVHHWLPVNPRNLKTAELTRYDVFLETVKKEKHVFLGSYQAASSVSYKLRRQIYKLGGTNRRDFYDFLPQSYPSVNEFWFGAETYQGLPENERKKGYFEAINVKLTDDYRMVRIDRAQNPRR